MLVKPYRKCYQNGGGDSDEDDDDDDDDDDLGECLMNSRE